MGHEAVSVGGLDAPYLQHLCGLNGRGRPWSKGRAFTPNAARSRACLSANAIENQPGVLGRGSRSSKI